MLTRLSNIPVSRKTVFSSNNYKIFFGEKFANQIRPVPLHHYRMSSSDSFQESLKKLKTLKEPDNTVKLNLYALYKQATEGTCRQSKPSMFDMVAKAKYDAWSALGSMSQDEAKSKYVSIINELSGAEQNQASSSNATEAGSYDGITYTVGPHITEIILDRPHKKNAILKQMYTDMITALKKSAENDTYVTVLTGRGEYFSSGNDLSNFASVEGDLTAHAEQAGELLKNFVNAFIDFPKILIAAVNGPAVGIPVTILGLCDIVYASDKATFHTPFSLLGQSPEGCSTYTFPKIMGPSKASEILYLNKKFTAAEAQASGLVSEVFPHDKFMDCVNEKLASLPDVSKKSLIYSKELVRGFERETLHKVNEAECKRLVERWLSPDCMEAIMKFFQRKSKL